MQWGHHNLNFKSLLLIACGWSLGGSAFSADWEGNLSVAPGLIYTDNVCLTKNNKRDDFTAIATLTPSGNVSIQSSKSSFFASGAVSINTLTDGDLRDDGCTGRALDDRQEYFPRIHTTFNTVLIGNWVRLDAKGTANQNRVSSALPSSDDELDRNGNTNTYYRYSISPHMSRRLAGSTSYHLRYTWSQVINTHDSVSDSWRHAVVTGLGGAVGPRINWNLSGRYSLTGYSDDVVNLLTGVAGPRKDTELKSASLGLAYQINRSWQVNGRYGWEWNDFQTFNNANTGGSAWDMGARWTPSPRTVVEIGSGDRFFGQTPRISFSHQRRRSEISGNYNKRITFQRDLTTQGTGLGSESGFDEFGGTTGGTGFNQNGDFIDSFGTNTSIYSTSAILDERATLRYSWTGRPGNLIFFGSYSQQTRAEDGRQADYGQWEISFRPQLSTKYTVVGSVGWEEVVPAGFLSEAGFDDFPESQKWTYTLTYKRPLNTRLKLSLEYRFTDRQSDAGQTFDQSRYEYQENMVRATLNINL